MFVKWKETNIYVTLTLEIEDMFDVGH